MNHVEPKRLVDDADSDSELRALLLGARSAPTVSDADVARFTARLAPFVGVSLVGGGAPGAQIAPVSPAPLTSAVAKGTIGAKAAAGLGAAGALKVGLASLAVGASLWLAHGHMRTPPAVAPAPSVQVEAPVVSAPAPEVQVQPIAPEAVVAPVEPPARVKRRSEKPKLTEVAAEAPDELGLIRDAQAARSQPARALSLLAEHQKFYPTGLLSQEREVLAVEALIAVGRRADAEKRAAAFTRAYPGSVHAARLRTMLGAPLAE